MISFLNGLLPDTSWPTMVAGGHLMLLALGLALVAFLLILTATATRSTWSRRLHLTCPQSNGSADVRFRHDRRGKITGVARCSLLRGRRPTECTKACVGMAMAGGTPETVMLL